MEENSRQWYVVNTYAGNENKVKDNLEKRMQSMGIADNLFRVIVAEESQIEVKNGKQKEVIKNVFPGYLFVEMIMTDESWYVVRNTPGVTGFIGSSGKGAKPFAVKPEEIDKILRRLGKIDTVVEVDFTIGDNVQILSGPFAGMEGKIESMDDANQMASVLIILFGRETPTDIKYIDIQKTL